MVSLVKSIYSTLAFFDAQDLPLTLMEIRGYLVAVTPHLTSPTRGEERGVSFPQSFPPLDPDTPVGVDGEGKGGVNLEANLSDIEKILQSELADKIHYANGFYFLAGRADLVVLRRQKYQISLGRMRKAKKMLSFLRFLPYLRAAAISGSLALLNSSGNSDIDLFIIVKKNRVWIARMFISLFFQLLGQRRHGQKISARFCLNHYLAADTLITRDKNLYTAVEYASLLPVLGEKEFVKFWQENSWIKIYLPDPRYQQANHFFKTNFSVWQKFAEAVLDCTIGPALNYLSGIYQKRRIKTQEYILVSDSELSFHPGSRGQKVLSQFQENLDRSHT